MAVPLTALMAQARCPTNCQLPRTHAALASHPYCFILQEHDHVPTAMLYITLLLLAAAFLPPLPRTLGFVGGGAVCSELLVL